MDNTIKGSIGDYRNSISKNNIQTLYTGEDDIISQLSLSFDIERDKIENINEELYFDIKSPKFDESPSNNVEID